MTEGSSEDFPFDYRTSHQRFQERLLAAQQNTIERQIEEGIESRSQDEVEEESTVPLAAQRESLQAEVMIIENEVETLRKELAERRARREREASIRNMTPEERAAILEKEEQVQEQEPDTLDTIDENVIFDYLISAGSAPLPANAADLSATDFTKPHEEMRAMAMQRPEALEQIKYAHFKLTKMFNEVRALSNKSAVNVRHCELEGVTYDQPFKVEYDVLESELSVSNLSFQVSIEMQLETGPILEKIKEESNILLFFRLLIHYSRLTHERKTLFNGLQQYLSDTHVIAEEVGDERLKFYTKRQEDPELTLVWKTVIHLRDVQGIDLKVCEQVLPDIEFELFSGETDLSEEKANIYRRIPEIFKRVALAKGPLLASQIVVSAVFRLNSDGAL